MKVGAYAPNRPEVSIYVMSADETPMYYDMENLTPKQQSDHEVNIQLLAHMQVALMAIGKGSDHVALYEEFRTPPYDTLLERYHTLLSSLDIDMIPMEHVIYAPSNTFYPSVADQLPPVEMINLLMVSPSNSALHEDTVTIERNRKLHSKLHLAENAPKFNIPIPDTIITQQPLAGNKEAQDFFDRNQGRVVLKMPGFSGGRNVAYVNDPIDGDRYLEEFDKTLPVLLQQRIPLDIFQEWAIDLHITDRAVTIDNIRRVMLHDGLWIGNLFHADYPLSPEQETILLRVGEYARTFGFGTADGNNFGIDFFLSPEGNVLVSEINPRWTAGLFASELLKRLRVSVDAVAYFDYVAKDRCFDFLDYAQTRLPGSSSEAFALVPLGFMPFDVDIDGKPFVSVYSTVIGDFAGFRADVQQRFGPPNFPNADRVPL